MEVIEVTVENQELVVNVEEIGRQGLQGPTGDKGDTGAAGADGVSPAVSVAEITGGHRVTVTDAEHPGGQTFDVMDGQVSQAQLLRAFPTDTASGATASFPDGADGVPVKALTVSIRPVQSGSGDPAPDNVRLISGWTQAKIFHSGADTSGPDVVTVDLDGTIYGGTLDVLTGVLTVDKVAVTIDGDTLKANDIYPFSPNARTKTNYPTGLTGKYNSTSTFCLSDKLKPNYSQVIGNPANATELCVYPHSSGIMVTFPASTGVTTKALADAWFAENTPMVCYELATPLTVQLTPAQLSTLLGENNIWSDAGDVSAEYRADPTLYIRKLTGSTEEDMIADAPIASGKYFLVGNRLFLSTASIAAGATLTPGTNCTETNLAAALNAINS